MKNLEQEISRTGAEFSALFMAVQDLGSLLRSRPHLASPETIDALVYILRCKEYRSRKQVFFVYKEAADALASLTAAADIPEAVRQRALNRLKSLVVGEEGPAHRAAAEALGALPLNIQGPRLEEHPVATPIPAISWTELLRTEGLQPRRAVRTFGRSLAMAQHEQHRWFVVKFLRRGDSVLDAHREALWMTHLRDRRAAIPLRFDIPQPVSIHGSYILSLPDAPRPGMDAAALHPERYAIAFWAHRDYFTYLNEHVEHPPLNPLEFREALHRNAWLLGKLASWGIVHSAPIPLFHNRIQRQRRSDGGLYQWHRRGRLDRWLHSCRFPNLGLSGIRDLEHLTAFAGPPHVLYQQVGTHLLSLFLVAGSYFRHKDMDRVGLDRMGNPVDARDLFDLEHLGSCLLAILEGYHLGFTGKPVEEDLSEKIDQLAQRMRDEMGRDRHMEEILRAADQREMTEAAFCHFLVERGLSQGDLGGRSKGEQDLCILTGPHLGGFNQQISIPELIDFVATVSALCIAGSYDSRICGTGVTGVSAGAWNSRSGRPSKGPAARRFALSI